MLISANTVDELNQKVNEMLSQGMYLWGSPFIVPSDYHNQTRFFSTSIKRKSFKWRN